MRTADVAVSAQDFRIPLPLMVAAFCLLWSSAFAVAKVGIADCPPLLLLTFRFLLAGALMLGAAAVTGVSLKLKRRDLLLSRRSASPTRRPISASAMSGCAPSRRACRRSSSAPIRC